MSGNPRPVAARGVKGRAPAADASVMAKSKGGGSDRHDGPDDDEPDDDAPDAARRPRLLGPATVAKPCLIGAALLAVAATALPH